MPFAPLQKLPVAPFEVSLSGSFLVMSGKRSSRHCTRRAAGQAAGWQEPSSRDPPERCFCQGRMHGSDVATTAAWPASKLGGMVSLERKISDSIAAFCAAVYIVYILNLRGL